MNRLRKKQTMSHPTQNEPAISPSDRLTGQIVTGIWMFILAGATTGVCVGLLRFESELDRGALPIGKGLTCAGVGALFGFLVGAVIWGFAKEIGRGITLLRVLAILLVVAGIGAAIGWGVGAQSGLYSIARDRPRGMIKGAIVGAIIGVILGLMNLRSKAAGTFRTISDASQPPPDNLENSAR
jgi:hypothetical protein